MATTRKGTVKFYSTEKGFGFIFDEIENEDIFFHITEVKGPEPPNSGDFVSFEVYKPKDRERKKARSVEVLTKSVDRKQPAVQKKSNQSEKRLEGFPCIRGDSIRGFVVEKRLGKVSAGQPVLRWFRAFNSANDARDALIEKAQSMGANAIFHYTWHNDRRRQERVFRKNHYLEDNFWAEGEAVVLAPDIGR